MSQEVQPLRVKKSDLIFTDEFLFTGRLSLDPRNRVSLGKALDALRAIIGSQEPSSLGIQFLAFANEQGQILLSPVIPTAVNSAWPELPQHNGSAEGASADEPDSTKSAAKPNP